MSRNFKEITIANQRRFLNCYAECCRLDLAAEQANVSYFSHYHWLKVDESYRQAFEEAKEIVADKLESEAVRRAYNGVIKPVFYKGVECGGIREYSDTLMILLLKACKPDKYRERIEISVIDQVRKLATDYGLDPEEAVKEVERLLAANTNSSK